MSRSNLSLLHAGPHYGYEVYTDKAWEKDDQILICEGEIAPTIITPRVSSLRITEHFSLEFVNCAGFEYHLNHSCEPNCYWDFGTGIPILTALENIPKNDELCYNYNTIEWDMSENLRSFPCHCYTDSCIGWIQGFRYLTSRQKEHIKDMLSPYIRMKYQLVPN